MELFPSPKQLTAQRIAASLFLALLLGGGNALLRPAFFFSWAALCAAAWVLLCCTFLPLRHRALAYTVLPESIGVRSGILKKKRARTPVEAIQYVSLTQSPLQRVFGIALLRLHLAGGKLDLQGLPLAQAQEIARRILAQGGVGDA